MTMLFRAFATLVLALALLIAPVAPALAAAFYVDNTLGELAAVNKARVAEPKPVQLLFQFTTDGKANARAAKYIKPQIFEHVKASGLFSEVSETPVAGGAVLMITINNIGEKGAAKKGFGAGLTFGLAGTIVVDDYTFTAEYVSGADATPIKVVVPHRLYTRIGNKTPPANATEYKKADLAIAAVMRQGTAHAVNRVALEPAFGGVADVPPPPIVQLPPIAAPAPAQPTKTEK